MRPWAFLRFPRTLQPCSRSKCATSTTNLLCAPIPSRSAPRNTSISISALLFPSNSLPAANPSSTPCASTASTIFGNRISREQTGANSPTSIRNASCASRFRPTAQSWPFSGGIWSRTRSCCAIPRSSDLSATASVVCAGGRGTLWRRLVQRVASCVIAAPRAHFVAVVVQHFHFDPVVLTVRNEVRGVVSNRILVTQFVADILERLIQIVHVIRKKRPAAGLFRQVRENLVAVRQMHLAVRRFQRIGLRKLNPLGARADGVNHHAGALRHFNRFRARVIGKIVFAVADQNHYAAHHVRLVSGRPRRMAQLLHAGVVNRIVDGRAASGARRHNLVP